MKTKLAIIADDFTGSNDTGLQFSKAGAKTGVVFGLSNLNKALKELDVVVADTESRFDSKETAFEKVYQICRTLTQKGVPLIYKKLDSTMRGNIGAEIDGAIEGAKAAAALVAAAYPSMGRTTRDGICYVDGIPVAQTEIAKDPKTPISSSHISQIISRQSKRKVTLISLQDVRAGSDQICKKIKSLLKDGSQIIVADAVTDNDLAFIGAALGQLDEKIVPAGSAGLAEQMAEQVAEQMAEPLTIIDEQEFKPIVIVVGSVSKVTRDQVAYALKKNRVEVIDVKVQAILTGRQEEEKQRIIQELSKLCSQKSDIVIRSTRSPEDVEKTRRLGDEKGLDTFGTSEHIARFLGALTKEICSIVKLKGLVLTGGDTAIKVVEIMKISGTIIKDQVLPGVACGYFLSDEFGDIPVVTKAGAFGEKEAIVKIIDFLRKGE